MKTATNAAAEADVGGEGVDERPNVVFALVKDVAAYGIGDLLLKAASFFTLPIYTRLFTATEFGRLSYVTSAIGLITAVLALGGESAYARYFFEVRTEEERQRITSTWFFFLLAWASVLTLALTPASGLVAKYSFGSTDDRWLFALALLGMPIALLSSLLGQVLRNQFRPKLFAMLNVAATALTIVCSLFAAVRLQMGILGVVAGTLAAGLLLLPIRLWTVRGLIRPVFSIAWLRRLLSYGLPLVPASLAYWVFGTSDRILLGKLSTLAEVGFYSVASSLTSVLGLAYGALGQAWSPHAVRLYETDPQGAPGYHGRVLTYVLALFGMLAVGLTAYAREAILFVATDRYLPAALAIGPLSLGFMAYASTQVTAGGISITKQTHYVALYSWIAALLNVVLNLPLIPRWGMVAASWTTAIAYTFLTVAYGVTSYRLWPIVYERSKVTAIVGACFVLVLLVPPLDALQLPLPAALAAKTGLCLIFLGVLLVAGVLDISGLRSLFLRARQKNSTASQAP